jgi:cellulose synthase operon protein C
VRFRDPTLPFTLRLWAFAGALLLALLPTVCPFGAVPAAAAADLDDPIRDRIDSLADSVRSAPAFDSHVAGYVALRRLWSEWEEENPARIEGHLASLAKDARLPIELRAYATLLGAYAERRRGDLEGAKRHLAELGFVSKWLFAGPFDNEGKNGLLRAEGPELSGSFDLGATFQGKERPVRFRTTPEVFPYGWVDFGALIRPTEFACVYAAAWVKNPKVSEGDLWLGAAGAARVFWNGEEVLKDPAYRALDPDRLAVRVRFQNDWNQIVVKICGDETAPLFSLRVTKTDGTVGADFSFATDPPSGGSTFKKAQATKPAGAAVRGPLASALLPAAESGKKLTAAQLESLGRYLQLTAGDDPSERKARELARLAADREPTVPRLLLAGDLAEDRNQRAKWLEKAEARIQKTSPLFEQTQVLLARATQVRGGPNWRDSIPLYEKVLSLDKGNIAAIGARVELYGEAGLRETAITFLERALVSNPHSVTLLRLLASELSSAGRLREAKEVSDRYAQLRFDDATYVRGNLDQAVARRDETAARRWSLRLMQMAPDNAQNLVTAARTEFAFGKRAEGFALHRRALDMAPEDVEIMRGLADQLALVGKKDEQLRLLKKVLEIKPQEKSIREYLAHQEDARTRDDEKYAIASAEFLKNRGKESGGLNRRSLVNMQVTTVFPNGLASRFHQVVFQPLTDSAAAEAREYAFGYEADTETVQLRGAKVYRVSGQVEEASETGESDADDPSMSMYTSQRVVYVHFPRLFPGDVVELQYRVEDVAERNAFADYFGEVHYMESNEPVAYAEYTLIAPKSRNLFFNKPAVPGVASSVTETASTRIHRFIAKDLKPLDREPLQPPATESYGYVHASTYRSWDDMGKWYWGLVKDQFVADDEVRKRALEVTQGLTDEASKVRAVYNYVVSKTRYVALEFGIHGFKPYRCAQIFARGFGDCKDKATLIVTMLKQLGIPSTIVIVRTGMRGDFGTDIASLAPFDHAIAYVPSLNLFLDGTAEYTGAKELPSMDRGALAILVNEGKPVLTRLPDAPASESVTSRKYEAVVDADGGAKIAWGASVSGVHASSWRRRYGGEATRKARVTEDLGGDLSGIEIGPVETNDLNNLDQDVSIKTTGKMKQLVRREGDALVLPVGPKEFLVREYAPLATRKQTIRLSAQTTTVTEWKLTLPAGAKITLAPKSVAGQSAFGSYAVTVTTTGPNVTVRTQIALTKTRILPSEYAAFRKFCEEADGSLGQRIIYTK